MYTLIGTAKLNDIDPQAWLADVLARIADLPQTLLPELLPWHWKAERQQDLAAQPAAPAACLLSGLRLHACVDPASGTKRQRFGTKRTVSPPQQSC